MKIPYLNEKIRDDFGSYCDDYKNNCIASISGHSDESNPNGFLAFKHTYSLFVLLESLNNSDYFNDPTKEILLYEAFVTGSKKIAEKTARTISVRAVSEKDRLVRQGVKKRQFTPYLHEIYSDTLMLPNSYYSNNYRGCHIFAKCILEDMYRHVYYKDHPQEFRAIRMEEEGEHGLGLSPRFFRDYMARVSCLKILKDFKCKGDQDYEFTKEQAENVMKYLEATGLLLDCLELAYVSDRAAITDRLLRPPATKTMDL